jgi:hypothetical protein
VPFQASLRHSGTRLDLMLAYTFSKSMIKPPAFPIAESV